MAVTSVLTLRLSGTDSTISTARTVSPAPGKKYGYIIVPVVVPPGRDVVDALETGSDGYKTVGRCCGPSRLTTAA